MCACVCAVQLVAAVCADIFFILSPGAGRTVPHIPDSNMVIFCSMRKTNLFYVHKMYNIIHVCVQCNAHCT